MVPAVRCLLAADLTPLESFYLPIGTGPSPLSLMELENHEQAEADSKQKRFVPKKVDWKALEIVHPHAAGIDVGDGEHWVAISPDRDAEPVLRFGCFTTDLREMGR